MIFFRYSYVDLFSDFCFTGGKGPCLRSKSRSPPKQVVAEIEKHVSSVYGAPDDAWCAAHLAMLCSHATEAYTKYGLYSSEGEPQRGLLLNYEGLPASLPLLLLKLFNVKVDHAWLLAIENESKYYSPRRAKSRWDRKKALERQRMVSD